MGQLINHKQVIREVAKEARFLQSDVKKILDTLDDVIIEHVLNGDKVRVGLFSFYTKKYSPKMAWGLTEQEVSIIDTPIRFVIKPRYPLYRLLRANRREIPCYMSEDEEDDEY